MSKHTTRPNSNEIPYGYCHCGCGQKTPLSKTTRPSRNQIAGEPTRFAIGHGNRRPIAERFWEKVDRSGGPDACWLWQGVKSGKYGQIWHQGKNEYAHRVSYLLNIGPISDGLFVCHECDNRLCVNPAHLWLGTHDDNMQDMVDKGRSAPQEGSQNHSAKLTDADILQIRELAGEGVRHADIAKRYGVHRATVSYIVGGKTWTHI